MAFSVLSHQQRYETDGPNLFCDGCNKNLVPRTCIYHCAGHDGGFDLCLGCALSTTLASQHHSMRTCVVDARDKRLTSVPGPGVDEFRSIVTDLETDPVYRLPRRYYQFFHQTGISTRDLASMDHYEPPQETASPTTKKIDNDYTTYGPLDREKKEIRLAILLPGSAGDPLGIVLHPVPYPWNHQHVYAALSYTWGSLEETRQVTVGQSRRCGDDTEELRHATTFSCTASLEMALRGLRDKKTRLYLWIDALCINQGDLDERKHQVSFMAEIYSHAVQVAVWLGPPREVASAGAQVHNLSIIIAGVKKAHAERQATKDGHACNLDDEYHIFQHMVSMFEKEDSPLAKLQLIPKIQQFLNNPWFSRAWVAQEAWAARSLVVMCGGPSRRIMWETVLQANAYLGANSSRIPSIANAAAINNPGGRFQAVASGKPLWGRLVKDAGTTPPIPAIELLEAATMTLRASDPRDLIFSILGMSVETSATPVYPPLIAPDYTKPPWQVFADYTRWYMSHHKSLDVLGQVTYNRRGHINDIGSVPSWSVSPELIIPLRAGGNVSDRTPFHADGNTPLDVELIGDSLGDRCLITRGYEVDSIAWVDNRFFSPMVNFDSLPASEVAPFPWRISVNNVISPHSCGLKWLWGKVRQKHDLRSCNDESPCRCQRVLDAMLDALTGGRWIRMNMRVGLAEVAVADIQYELFDRERVYGQFASHWAASTDDPEMEQFCSHLRSILLPLVKKSSSKLFADGGMEAAYRKSLFMTSSGALGVCHPDARVGDAVVILFGCRVPVVLARNAHANDSWRFVSECYLNGIMYGEAVEARRKSDAPVQTFDLY